MWQCQGVSRSWYAKLRECKASPLAKRRTVKLATETDHYLCRSPHKWFLGNDTTACACWMIIDVSSWKVRSVKSCEDTRSVTESSNRSWEILQNCTEAMLPLVEDVEIDFALVAYSNDCIHHGLQHHHGSHLLAAVMDRWPSFSRFASRKLPKFHRF